MKKPTLGETIRLARTDGLGVTQHTFAHLVDVMPTSIYYWETGRRHPRYDCLIRMLCVVPPAFALQLLNAAGMENPEGWAIALYDEIMESQAESLAGIYGGNDD